MNGNSAQRFGLERETEPTRADLTIHATERDVLERIDAWLATHPEAS